MLKLTYLDWEIDIPTIETSKAARGEVSIQSSRFGKEVVVTPMGDEGFPFAFGVRAMGKIARMKDQHAKSFDTLTLGFVQNLRHSLRGAWYDDGGRRHVLSRRPVDRLPLVDHHTRWYKSETASSAEDAFEIFVEDTPHTGFPEVCPRPGAGQLVSAKLGASFTTCFAVERSWDTKERHALFAIDWMLLYDITRRTGGGYDIAGQVTVGSWKTLDKVFGAAGIVDTGTTPNKSEHVFIDQVDQGPTAH